MEEKSTKKKSILPIILLVLVLMVGSCIGGIYGGKKLFDQEKCAKDTSKKEDKKEEPVTDCKIENPDAFEIDLEEANKKLEWLNVYIQRVYEKESTSRRSNYYRFEFLNDGDEVLNDSTKKFDFVYSYAFHFSKDHLDEFEVEKIIGETAATGSGAVSVSEMKRLYKDAFDEELPDSQKYTSNLLNTGEVKDGYILGSFWSGFGVLGTKLEYNNIKKDGNHYIIVVDIWYFNENASIYEKSNDQLKLDLTKLEDGEFRFNSMKISKK